MAKAGEQATQQAGAAAKKAWGTTVAAIVAWYASNVALLISNKALLSNTGFRQPVFLTACHMFACLLIGGIWMAFTGKARPMKRSTLGRVTVLTAIFCVTVVAGNASLRYLPVSFTQAVGATTPLFTAMFAFALQGTREHWSTYASLLPIMAGIAIASGGEPLFHALGFVICIAATAGRALKSVVQALLMADPSDRLEPMYLLTAMSAVAMPMLLAAVAVLEPGAPAEAARMAATHDGFVMLLVGSSVLAYLVNLTNFLVTLYTSPLTLQVLGNFKGVIAAVASVFVFVNPVTAAGCLGYAVTIAGVFLYSQAKRMAHAAHGRVVSERAPSSSSVAGNGTEASDAECGVNSLLLPVSSSSSRTDAVASQQQQPQPFAQAHARQHMQMGDAHVEVRVVGAGPVTPRGERARAPGKATAAAAGGQLGTPVAVCTQRSPRLTAALETAAMPWRLFGAAAAALRPASPVPNPEDACAARQHSPEDPITVLAPFPSLQAMLTDRTQPAHVHAA